MMDHMLLKLDDKAGICVKQGRELKKKENRSEQWKNRMIGMVLRLYKMHGNSCCRWSCSFVRERKREGATSRWGRLCMNDRL